MQLRAFVMLRSLNGDWQVHVCRDIDTVTQAWRQRKEGDAGVLHIGFDRPPSSAFDALAAQHANRMLLTASARYSLTSGYEVHEIELGFVESLPVYLATRGFGYNVDANEYTAPPTASHQSTLIAPRGWVAVLAVEKPEYANAVASAGIFDDESYILNEASLDRDVRREVGRFRLFQSIGSQGNDPTWIARYAPPWLQSVAVSDLPLSVRISNVFNREKVLTVGDISKFETNSLLNTQNFGRKSFRELTAILLEALERGPTYRSDAIGAAETVTLLANVKLAAAKLDDRARDILLRRMGLGQPSQTLAEIGDIYKVTRERIRQIEAKLVRKIIAEDHWDDLLWQKLSKLLLNRTHPLPVIGVDAIDPWFHGIANNADALAYILENMCGDEFHVLEIDGIPYFARINGSQFADSEREAKALLSANTNSGWSEAYCRTMVASVLDTSSREFADLLWDRVSADCHFSEQSGNCILSGFGKSAEAIVEAALEEAQTPLHYTQIASAVLLRSGREVDVRRVHVAAQSVGFLFGRGRYGLAKHCVVDDEIQSACCDYVEQLILSGSANRQWHCSELVDLLRDYGIEDDALDKYTLDIILRACSSLQRLGRLTWASSQNGGKITRTDIRQAIASILREAGRPLATEEIASRLAAVRGTDQAIAIWNFDPVVRVGRGVWGLNDRDVPISRGEQLMLFENLSKILERTGVGIHITELLTAYDGFSHIDPDLMCALSSHNKYVGLNSDRYFYLREWGSSRREGVRAMISAVLTEHGAPMPFEAIFKSVENRSGRHLNKTRVSTLLQNVGDFDAESSLWSLRERVEDQDEDEEVYRAETT